MLSQRSLLSRFSTHKRERWLTSTFFIKIVDVGSGNQVSQINVCAAIKIAVCCSHNSFIDS